MTRLAQSACSARLLQYRVFPDAAGKMNLSLTQVKGAIAAGAAIHPGGGYGQGPKTRLFDGGAPGAGPPVVRRPWYSRRASSWAAVETGVFGAHMQVSLTNDGPVTIWLES